jgi:hypothetical protein
MERFFSIELRDLVRSNRVNSILIWYAGHGKYIHETGYWIPVDAKRDDEFTYFNINALKASLQSYSNYVTHTLVITDACESGPSFYQAMRSTPKERNCNDWQATKFKSSQVFASAGYGQFPVYPHLRKFPGQQPEFLHPHRSHRKQGDQRCREEQPAEAKIREDRGTRG